MNKLRMKEFTQALKTNTQLPKVMLFNPSNESVDQAFWKLVKQLNPKPIIVDFQHYDLNTPESLFRIYVDINYHAAEVSESISDEQLKSFVKTQFDKRYEWAKAGSGAAISGFLVEFMEEYQATTGKYPWIVLGNIDVKTEIIHNAIGSIVFDVIQSPYSENVVITCKLESWNAFERGSNIFNRLESRLRSSVAILEGE